MSKEVGTGFDEDARRFRVDGVPVTFEHSLARLAFKGAARSQTEGSPINQRECAGLNWPPLSISAEEPISISPKAVSRAGPFNSANKDTFVQSTSSCGPNSSLRSPPLFLKLSRVGVCHPVN